MAEDFRKGHKVEWSSHGMIANRTHRADAWSVHIFRVSSRNHQQQIVRAFRDSIGRGVIALGTDVEPGQDAHVVVESSTRASERYANIIVRGIDPEAERLHVTRAPSPSAA